MKILFAPFAKPLQDNGKPSPKDYPFAKELVELLKNSGHTVTQVGANGDKPLVEDYRRGLPFSEIEKLITDYDTAICVDSYLSHHCWLAGKKAIVIFGISDPEIFGHKENVNLLKDRKYLRPNQFDLYYSNQYNNDAYVSPQEVIDALNKI